MLSEKQWKGEAILRLALGALICVFAGTFLVVGLQKVHSPSSTTPLVLALVGASVLCLGGSLVLLKQVWEKEDPLAPLSAMLGCFCAGLMLGGWASRLVGTLHPSIGQMIISALSLQGAVLVLLFSFLHQHHSGWNDAFGLKNCWGIALGLGLATGCIFLPVGWLLQGVSAELMLRLHLQPEQQQVVQTLKTDHAAAARAVFAVISVVLVPPAEESFFRGILYPWVKRSGYPRLALWGTALAFAAIHANLMSFLPLTIFAVVLTLLYESTNNLLAPITAHAVFNAGNMVRLYLLENALAR